MVILGDTIFFHTRCTSDRLDIAAATIITAAASKGIRNVYSSAATAIATYTTKTNNGGDTAASETTIGFHTSQTTRNNTATSTITAHTSQTTRGDANYATTAAAAVRGCSKTTRDNCADASTTIAAAPTKTT